MCFILTSKVVKLITLCLTSCIIIKQDSMKMIEVGGAAFYISFS